MSALKGFLSTIVCILMFLTSYFGSLTIQCSLIWLSALNPSTYRKIMDRSMYFWICTVVTLMEYVIGIKFRLFGDKIQPNDRAIFIMNHRTRLDWLYFYGVLLRFGDSLAEEKIVLKNELKWIPGPGWAMQSGSYIFLVRKLSRDQNHLSNMIEYLSQWNGKYKILLFPEGTDYTESSLKSSHRFSEKNGLTKYDYVLQPRVAGFIHTYKELMRCSKVNGDKLHAVYDITVAYPDKNFATNELGFLFGRTTEVHFHCRRYTTEEIEGDSNSEDMSDVLKSFILNRWKNKESMLNDYYAAKNGKSTLGSSDEVNLTDGSVDLQRLISSIIILGNVVLNIMFIWKWPFYTLPFLFGLNCVYLFISWVVGGVDELTARITLGISNYRSPFVTN